MILVLILKPTFKLTERRMSRNVTKTFFRVDLAESDNIIYK